MKKRSGTATDVVAVGTDTPPIADGGTDTSECPSVLLEVALSQPTSIVVGDPVRLVLLDGEPTILAGARVLSWDRAELSAEAMSCLESGVRYSGAVISAADTKAVVDVRPT